MLFCNQSLLEGQYSAVAVRGADHNSSDKYAGFITSKSVRQSNSAQARSKTYTIDDCADEAETYLLTGTSVFTNYSKSSAARLDTWKRKRDAHKKSKAAVEHFEKMELFLTTKLVKIAGKMNNHVP